MYLKILNLDIHTEPDPDLPFIELQIRTYHLDTDSQPCLRSIDNHAIDNRHRLYNLSHRCQDWLGL